MNTEKFRLNHVMLYSKGWYKKTELIEDLKKCLSADGYNGECMNTTDVMNVLLRNYQRLPYHGSDRLAQMIEDISPRRCWTRGYFTKDNAPNYNNEVYPEYDYETAVIMFILSVMRDVAPKEAEITLPKPDYKNCLPPSYSVEVRQIKEILDRKIKGTDCTEEESAFIKGFLREHIVEVGEQTLIAAIQFHFPLEYGEHLDEMETKEV